jgi:hypothetical protein
MRHPLAQQIEALRQPHRRTDVLLFVMAVAAGVALLVTAALHAPLGWSPFG